MTFDGSKLLFYFTADQRVDFRTLVRELAKRFRTRIEMRQIGVRDKAQRLGGLGVCGRPLCCTTFLAEFEPVTMKMAKEPNLTLSPSKISGFCGRLMCCLGFENDFYRGVRGAFPPVGSRVSTPDGEGEVRGISALTGEVTVGLDSGATVKVAREAATLIPAAAGGEKRGGEGRS
jgi:cell fate regulator YaaT (PSP1 superfamily)